MKMQLVYAVAAILGMVAALLFGSIYVAYAIPRGGLAIVASCIWTGNISGSCLPSSDTTDEVSAPRPSAAGFADTFKFGSSPANTLLVNGIQLASCPGLYNNNGNGGGSQGCYDTSAIQICQTPGNVSSNTHPWSNQGVISWQPPTPVQYLYRSSNTGPYYNSIPAYVPAFSFESTTGTLTTLNAFNYPALMTGVCGLTVSSSFVDGILGDMPTLTAALNAMSSNDVLSVAAPPSPIPFWPATDGNIGPVAGTANPPSNLTVNLASGANIGYPVVAKSPLNIENNGTTINGNPTGSGPNASVFWVNPSNSTAAVRLDAGLDPTIENLNIQMSENGSLGPDVRFGTETIKNIVSNNTGCQDGACTTGRDHGIYIGGLEGHDGHDGLDNALISDSVFSNIGEDGWGAKIRGLNSTITGSFFGSTANNGGTNMHGAIDFPCGGIHSISNSVMEIPQYTHTNTLEEFGGMVQIDEEVTTNATTTVSGHPNVIQNCHSPTWLPTGTSFSATITGLNTFTTTTNPATVFPIAPYGSGFGLVTDLGVSGLLAEPALPVGGSGNPQPNWSGPVGGVYTVTVGPCYGGEGTLPLEYGIPIYSCFNTTSGSLTLYSLQNAVTLASNTTTTASITTTLNPAMFGIAVGDTLFDVTDVGNTVTGITGGGPYTVSTSCAPASGNCFTPSSQQVSEIAVVSGTYNSMTGAVSLTLGASTSIAPGTTFNFTNPGGTGSVASLGGNQTATAGTSGSTLNFAAPTSLGAITISGGQLNITSSLPTLTSAVDVVQKNGPIQLTASTTGTGCDGANVLCGIAFDPRGTFLGYGLMVLGTDVTSYACVVAAKLAYVYPSGGSTGTGYNNAGGTITLGGNGNIVSAPVFTYTTDGSGHINGGTVTTGGIIAGPLPLVFTQTSTSSTGTGATFRFGYPVPITGGSGSNYTITLTQPSGANCISGSTTNQVYNFLMPTSITNNADLVFWDGPCPSAAVCQLYITETFNNNPKQPWQLISTANSVLVSSNDVGGPTFGAGSNGLILGGTDAGGNIMCNKRVDPGTSSRCYFPPYTAASFTGQILNGTLTVGCSSACPTISSGTYNNTTGETNLTISASGLIPAGVAFTLSGLTGTGGFASLDGQWYGDQFTTGSTLSFPGPAGLGATTITGGNVNATGASACLPGMYVWNNQPPFESGKEGITIAGTRIASGGPTSFVLAFQPGGPGDTNVPSGTPLSCGWTTPSSGFTGTIASNGELTLSNLVGSIHTGDYITDANVSGDNGWAATPGVTIGTNIDSTHWNTVGYLGAGISTEQMVTVH